MTPEQKLHAKLKTQLTKFLPKGRWMLQRIETSTGSGVPDNYFSFNGFTCWLETKTQEYEVTPEQINWSHAHDLTGGIAYVVTEVDKEIVLLDYDDRMTDCSSLGVYLRRYKPLMKTLNSWLEEIQLDLAIAERKD
jgi:hypothetical protein